MKILIKIYSLIFIKYSKLFSRENLYTFLGEAIEKYVLIKNNKKILSFGAGGGINSFIKSKGLNPIEIDIDRERKPDLVLDIQNMHLMDDNSVDVIFCLEVLEHVRNPFKAVEEIKRILKPNGIFIGSTPFIMPIHDEPYDYFRYTKYGILNLFSEFECLELKERNSYIKSWYVVLLRLLNIGNVKQGLWRLFYFRSCYCYFLLYYSLIK